MKLLSALAPLGVLANTNGNNSGFAGMAPDGTIENNVSMLRAGGLTDYIMIEAAGGGFGTELTSVSDCDDCYQTATFSADSDGNVGWSYGGREYTQVHIDSNGMLGFEEGNNYEMQDFNSAQEIGVKSMGDATFVANAIAPFWMDLNPGQVGNSAKISYFQVTESQAIVDRMRDAFAVQDFGNCGDCDGAFEGANFDIKWAMVVTYENVPPYHNPGKAVISEPSSADYPNGCTSSFQAMLVKGQDGKSYVMFNYGDINMVADGHCGGDIPSEGCDSEKCVGIGLKSYSDEALTVRNWAYNHEFTATSQADPDGACYKEGNYGNAGLPRDLTYETQVALDQPEGSIKWCREHCNDLDYKWAALQAGQWCWCGSGTYGQYGLVDDQNECNSRCSQDTSVAVDDQDMCGGDWLNHIYIGKPNSEAINLDLTSNFNRAGSYLYGDVGGSASLADNLLPSTVGTSSDANARTTVSALTDDGGVEALQFVLEMQGGLSLESARKRRATASSVYSIIDTMATIGCWCGKMSDPFYQGKGDARGDYDLLCKTLAKCQNIAKNCGDCVSTASTDYFYMNFNPDTSLVECATSDNDCDKELCACHLTFANDVLTAIQATSNELVVDDSLISVGDCVASTPGVGLTCPAQAYPGEGSCHTDCHNGERDLHNRIDGSHGNGLVTAIQPGQSSRDWCINGCHSLGYELAGVQMGNECWCDNTATREMFGESFECNMDCAQGSGKCGGNCQFNIYNARQIDL